MRNFLKDSKAIIGMIHVEALPGTPKFKGPMTDVIAKAKAEAQIYKESGIDILMIENMHDVPFDRNVGPEIVSAMAIVGYEVKQATGLRCGVQILAAANKEALGAAQAGGLDFVRAEGFVFGHIADEGYIDGCSAEVLRYRRHIEADDILVITDVKKKQQFPCGYRRC